MILSACGVTGAFVCPAEAINCYECDGSQDKVCNDPFGKNATTKSGCVQCSKWKGSYSGIEGTFVKRECLLTEVQADLNDYRCADQDALGVKGETCWCNKNLCNGSETSAASNPAVALPQACYCSLAFWLLIIC